MTLRRERNRVQDVDSTSPSDLGDTARVIDSEGEALPPGGYAYGAGEVSTDAAPSESESPDQADSANEVARANNRRTTHYIGDDCPGSHLHD